MPMDVEKIKTYLRNYTLTFLTVIGVVAGVLLGFILRSLERERWWTKREVMYVQFVGDLYLRMLKCLILPLMISAVVSAIGSLELKTSWKIGIRSFLWFVAIQYIAVLEGIIFAVAIRPGVGATPDDRGPLNSTQNVLVVDSVLDIFRNLFPPNLIEASLFQYHTVLVDPRNATIPLTEWEITHKYFDSINILGLICFSVFLALAVGLMNENSQPLVAFFSTLEKCMMMAVNWVLWISPLGVFSLVTAKLLEEQNLGILFERLGLYFVTVLVGLFVHATVVLPAIYFVLTRKTPFKFAGNMIQALITAFGTASSAVTIPVSMECLEKRNKIERRLVQLMIPIGTTLNMDGTALYEAVAIVFISQTREVPFNFGQLVLVSVTVTAACLGGAGIPQGGLMIMVMILGSLNLPPEDVTLIVAIDWLLDRFRTTVNVLSDAYGTAIVEHYSASELARLSKETTYSPLSQDDMELTAKEVR